MEAILMGKYVVIHAVEGRPSSFQVHMTQPHCRCLRGGVDPNTYDAFLLCVSKSTKQRTKVTRTSVDHLTNSLDCETGASLRCADVTVAPPIQVHTKWRGNNLDVCCGPVGQSANSR